MDCCVVLFRGCGCRFFCVDTNVDFNTEQVTYTVQLHSFVFEECRKSHFDLIQDADLCSTVSLLKTVVGLVSIRFRL